VAVTAAGGPHVALRALSRAESERLLTGVGRPVRGLRWHADYPTGDTGIALAMLFQTYTALGRPIPEHPVWWLHQVIVDGVVVGDVGCHGPPPDGGPVGVEIGYCLVAERHGEGIGTAACRLLVEHAWAAGATEVTAQAPADNPASRAVLRHVGFRPAGGDRFAIRRPAAAGDPR
jgi:GNAT superfamily N-acetyltransferase